LPLNFLKLFRGNLERREMNGQKGLFHGTPEPWQRRHDEKPMKAKTTKTKQKETTAMKTKLVKSITSSLLFGCALISLVAAMALGTSGTARAALGPQPCGVYTLRGSYLFATHGWNIVSGVAVPKAIVEGINFNGDGTLVSPFATVSINGTIIRASKKSSLPSRQNKTSPRITRITQIRT